MTMHGKHIAHLVAAVLVAASLGCGGAHIPRPPAPEDSVARLQRNIAKVRHAIESTQQLIGRARGQPYLPDLYLRLAELYVEEAKYHYYIAYEGTKRRERAVTSVQARLLKDQAIAVYNRIMREFPDFREADKVLFSIAHEQRELGTYDEMLRTLQRIVDDFPKSAYRNESLLVIGDYHFDKNELPEAERFYRLILASPESSSHGMARYKLAWVRMNKEDFKGALDFFEQTIKGMVQQGGGAQRIGTDKRIDLRREALVDLVFAYTEVHGKNPNPLPYFRKNADSRTTYLAALAKLGRRMSFKGLYKQSTLVYREILNLGGDTDDTLDHARMLYDGVIRGKTFDHAASDVELILGVFGRNYYSWRLNDKEKANLFAEFEPYARDIATKSHLKAKEEGDKGLYATAAEAYRRYLDFFSAAPQRFAMQQNHAEALFSAEKWYDAGRAYAEINTKVPAGEQKQATYTTVVSFWNALKESKKLSRLQLATARAGLRIAGRDYIARYPKGDQIAKVKFNIARTYYDEGNFEEAVELFTAFVTEFPAVEETSVAAHLALDCKRARDDFEGLAEVGKRLAADERLAAPLRAEITEIVKGAESRELDKATLKASGSGDAAAEEGLLKYATSHAGSELGEKALLNAFVTARNSDDFEKVFGIGERFLKEYPKSNALPDVLATLGKMAAQAVEFRRSARYLEEAARRKPGDARAVEMLRAAAAIRAHLGDASGAKEVYRLVLQRSQSAGARREAALQLADLLDRTGQLEEASQAYASAIGEGATGAATYFKLGYAKVRLQNPEEALKYLRLAADRGRGADSAEDADGAAAAQFYLGQVILEEFQGIAFGGDRSVDRQILMAKKMRLDGAQQAYLAAVRAGRPAWSIAALARLAVLYEGFALFIEGAPAPEGMSAADAQQYKNVLKKESVPWRRKAKEALQTCVDLIHKQSIATPILTAATKACLSGQPLTTDPGVRPQLRGGSRGGALSDQAAVLRKRIAKNSKDYDALGKLATLMVQAGDIYEAKMVLDKAIEGGAPSAVWNLRGVVTFQLGYVQEAYDNLRRAVDRDPHNPYARANLAVLFQKFGYAKEARNEAAKVSASKIPSAVDLVPGAREVLSSLGVQ
jgi:tetratricopeptide (TPR) repeat protein